METSKSERANCKPKTTTATTTITLMSAGLATATATAASTATITHVLPTFLGQKLKYYVCFFFSFFFHFCCCCLAVFVFLWFGSQYFMLSLSAAFRQIKIASGRSQQKCFSPRL